MAANFSIDILTRLSDKFLFFLISEDGFFSQQTKMKQSFIELKYTIFNKLNYNLYYFFQNHYFITYYLLNTHKTRTISLELFNLMEDRLPFLIMTVRNIILLSYDTLLMISIFSYALRSEREGFMLRCLY